MTLIACEFDCKYQKEGYCNLESSMSYVNNTNSEINCIHYVKRDKNFDKGERSDYCKESNSI